VVCFDHQGVGDIVTAECGIKVPVTNAQEAIPALAQAIRSMAEDRGKLLHLSDGACMRARDYLWSANGDRVNSLYWQHTGARQSRTND
jgi:hypothetical protein